MTTTNTTITLTANELTVLKAIDDSEYGCYLTDAIWSFSIADNCNLAPTSIPGVVSSLVKKGLVRCAGYGNDAEVRMTDIGAHEYIRANGGSTKEVYDV